MKGKKILLAALLMGMLVCLSACAQTKSKEVLRFGTGGKGGNYYSYGTKLAESVASDTDYQLKVTNTGGSAANLRLLSQNYLDMAIVQSDTLQAAIQGEGLFDGAPLTGFHSVTGLYTELCQIIVPADSPIQTIDDLRGKRVSIGAQDSGVMKNAQDILGAYGLTLSDLVPIYKGFQESADGLEKGAIDAFFCTASAPTAAVAELSRKMEIRLVPVSDDVTRGLLAGNDAYTTGTVPAGTYGEKQEELNSIGVTAVLVARDDLAPEAEAAVVGILQAQNEDLQKVSFGLMVPENAEKGIFKLALDMYQTLALAVAVLFLGDFLRKRIYTLQAFCIPAPVVGGLLFAVLSCILYVTGVVEFSFDETLKNVCMVIFFTSVGFQANLKVLKSGGVSLVIFLAAVTVLIVAQNGLAIGLSQFLNIDPMIGMCTGSIPMVGGHGTSGAFGIVLEDLGLEGATTLATAAATFGLVMGSLMGGPLGNRLIMKHDLLKTAVIDGDDTELRRDQEVHDDKHVSQYANAAYQISIAMGIGTIVSYLLTKTGMTFPVYIGAMIVAAIMRNLGEYTGKLNIRMGEIDDIGGICLSLFLGIAMITLKLWQLAALALPLFILLLAQTIFMAIFAYFIVFNVMGRNYDAAVLASGTCGFGMGATPNAMANMQAVTQKFVPSVKAFILVPIVGSMFADFINSMVITFFINIIK